MVFNGLKNIYPTYDTRDLHVTSFWIRWTLERTKRRLSMPFLTGENHSLTQNHNLYGVQRYWSQCMSLKIAHFRLEGETLGRMLDYLSRWNRWFNAQKFKFHSYMLAFTDRLMWLYHSRWNRWFKAQPEIQVLLLWPCVLGQYTSYSQIIY